MDEEKTTKKNEKAIFFLRHNNDIDHIVPVLYKWLSTENIPTDVIITTKRSLLDDYRINFLKQFKNVRIFYINDLFKKISLPYLFNYLYFKDDTKFDRIIRKYHFIKKRTDKTIKQIAEKIFKDMERGIVVFDWTTTYFVLEILKNAKNKGFITISLPHGDWPYVNYLITKEDLNYNCFKNYEDSKIFDYVIVPNNSWITLYKNYIDEKKLKVLGSPRYCDEWLSIISKIIPSFYINGDKDKLKIVFFLRNRDYPIFWEEVVRTIRLVLQFPDVYLIVKHHPRNTKAKKITDQLLSIYPELENKINKNIKFIYGEEHSGSLIRWANVIIDVGTSVTWEAVKLNKNVIMPEYLHANYSKIAYYIHSAELKSRDDLYNIIEKISKNHNYVLHNEKEKNEFIKNVIDVPDKYVLERYCKFLNSFLDETYKT